MSTHSGSPTPQSVAIIVVNSSGEGVLVSEASRNLPTLSIDDNVLSGGSRLLELQFGLRVGVHVTQPLEVTTEAAALPESALGSASVHWILYMCCSDVGEVEPLLMLNPSLVAAGSALAARWHPLDEAASVLGGAVRAHALTSWVWATVSDHLSAAELTDLSGTWTREASLNLNVEGALHARGLSAERAHAEATKPYTQRWRRSASDSTAWDVTTFDANEQAHHDGAAPSRHRTLTYELGDWEETYVGGSTLHGKATTANAPVNAAVGTLVRRTGWMLMPESSPSVPSTTSFHSPESHELEPPSNESGLFGASGLTTRSPPRSPEAAPTGGGLPPRPRAAAHTTWTSRTNLAGEIVSRMLYDQGRRMLVRRTLMAQPVVANALAGRPPIVCEEVFVRADDGPGALLELA